MNISKELLNYFNGNELPANVWLSKYAQPGDITPDCMHKRMAKQFARIEKNYLNSEIENSCSKELSDQGYRLLKTGLSEENIYNLFKDFKYIVPQGSIMSQLGNNSIGSLSNCFVVGQPIDSYGGIFLKEQEMIQLMKRRGGVGIDISKLRPKGTPTTNAAKSSTGAVSFMHRFSNGTREVAQEGRRGALMISIDINHPDVMEFIKIKRDLTQVTGANISIKLNDEFMEAVKNDEDYILRFPCDLKSTDLSNGIPEGVIIKQIRAKEYWDEIIKSAHNVAEPGLMFWDTMVNYSPDGVYPQFKQVTTNPCSEIAMQEYDACRLIAVNLFSFVIDPFGEKARFDFELFSKVNYEAMRLSDDLIDLELENIEKIINKIKADPEPDDIKSIELDLWIKVKETAGASRRTGLGFTALGDTLAALNLKYDSKEGLEVIEAIMASKLKSELDCTTDLAILRGRFKGCDKDLEFPVIRGTKRPGNQFYDFLCEKYPKEKIRLEKYGRRNVSWSTVAPTGTVSILTQTTSGIEPLFMPYYIRRKKVNPGDTSSRVDFTDQNGDTWQEFPVLHPKFADWLMAYSETKEEFRERYLNSLPKESLDIGFKESPWFESTANDIDWIKRVEIQSTIQKYITHSISSTINLPETVKESEVSEIYLESWKKGLKGITVYRDGSRSGVLVSSDKKNNNSFEYKDAIKRPKQLDGQGYTSKSGTENYNIFVGTLNNKPYEVFINTNTHIKGEGVISKTAKGKYIFIEKASSESLEINSNITDEQAAITRLISTSLRHGADIKFIVEQLNKIDGDLFSFTKVLARILKKYIPEGAKSTMTCKDCSGTNVIFEEGCFVCKDCGSSGCS